MNETIRKCSNHRKKNGVKEKNKRIENENIFVEHKMVMLIESQYWFKLDEN